MFACVIGRYVASSLISTQTFRMALTVSVGSCAEVRRGHQWRNQFWQSLEEGAGKRCSECACANLVWFPTAQSYLFTTDKIGKREGNNNNKKKKKESGTFKGSKFEHKNIALRAVQNSDINYIHFGAAQTESCSNNDYNQFKITRSQTARPTYIAHVKGKVVIIILLEFHSLQVLTGTCVLINHSFHSRPTACGSHRGKHGAFGEKQKLSGRLVVYTIRKVTWQSDV